jgi:soluble lytic murein transglycosylase-like protein
MFRSIIAFLLLLSASVHCQNNNQALEVKNALAELRKFLDTQKNFNKNPLDKYNLDLFSSRGYLYYYRALGNLSLAKSAPITQKLFYWHKALNDLHQAKTIPGIESQRIELIINDTLKAIIEFGIREKKYALIINSIEQLSQQDRRASKYVVYYGYALFNLAQYDDLKRLSAQYAKIFNDEKIILSFLTTLPNWKSHITPITTAKEETKTSQALVSASYYTKNTLLTNPQHMLDYLSKSSYFSDADAIFKLASPAYFSLVKKNGATSQEKAFVALFERLMPSFAPAFLDELITTHWKNVDLKSALSLSEAFLKQYEGHSLYPKVLFNLGRIHEDNKNYTQAFTFFKRFITCSDNASYLEFARFRIAWVLHLAKKDSEARPYFAEYIKNYPEGRYASTCEYFLSKTSGSQEKINDFIKKYPLNLYSYILADEFKLPNKNILNIFNIFNTEENFKTIRNNSTLFKADIKTIAQLNLARELLEFDLKDDAIKILKNIAFAEHNEVLALYLAAQLHELKDTHGVVSNLIKALSNSSSLRPFIPWKSLFPQFRFETIDKIIAENNLKLSKFLILSIIRQESMFASQARSSANALGLMQLTQATAQQSAKSLKLKDFSLLNEEDNLKLGIKTFSDLLKKFDNRLDYALSAYNAGETPTRLWIKLRGDLAPLDFIESIPYQETRQYVKNILRNYAIYNMIYNQTKTPLVSFLAS